MHFFSRVTFVALQLLLVSSSEVFGQPPKRNDATLAARIQAYLAPLEAHELSGTLLVARGKRIIIEKSFGYANHERAGKQSYDELLQKYVAKPVRASTVRHVDSRTILQGRATSAIPVGETVLNAPLRDLSFLVGAGSVYTTPRDIFAVMQGILNDVYGPEAREWVVRENGIHWKGNTTQVVEPSQRFDDRARHRALRDARVGSRERLDVRIIL